MFVWCRFLTQARTPVPLIVALPELVAMPPIRISRSRMTACPACSRHIRVAEKLDETQCPFCGVDLKSAVHDARTSTLTRLRDGISSGTGVIAASLASASLVVACSTEQQATPV